ncbi:hypothetical protein SB14R_18145 [Pseudomonas oryzihabitans]|nr:hypothetical protein NS376_10720 [Pseudomonas psychrotolerans]KTT22312.1 hypothetical protein SB14R_18145 [Pseudomonas psychrotolerans]
MQAIEIRPQWAVNDLCNVIVGFRNYSTHATRSRYVSFAVVEQPRMCELLVDLARGQVDGEAVCQYPQHLFEQLIDYGFLTPLDDITWRGQLKRLGRLLDSGRLRRVPFRGRDYYVTSLVFMAFYSQLPGQFLKEHVILPAWSPGYAEHALRIAANGLDEPGYRALPNKVRRRLDKHGLVTSIERLPQRERFFAQRCQLDQALFDELPDYYRPTLSANDLDGHRLELVSGIYERLEQVPQALRCQLVDPDWAQSCAPTLWIEDPVKGIVAMRWLTTQQQHDLTALRESRLAPAALDPVTRMLFLQAGILHDPASLPARREAWRRRLETLSARMGEDGCVTFEQVLPPLELAIARRYLRFMMEGRFLLLDRVNGKTQQRFWCHRDAFTFYLHGMVCALLNQVLPKPVKPGHNALTIYQDGATLPRHQDDVQAFTWVMSLPIEACPEHDRHLSWPIYVETPRQVHQAHLLPGDGHLIDPQMPHWRDRLEQGRLGILFLWFVPVDYRGFVNGSWVD